MKNIKLSVVGLGYVGLPVAVAFSSKSEVVGYDQSLERINELSRGVDRNGEVDSKSLCNDSLSFSVDSVCLANCNFYIVAVPTPVDDANIPNLKLLIKATETVALYLKPGDVVVYESTVYPGVTEDICVPILEKISGLTAKKDFKYGYSPERINPGEKERTFTKITKIVSGCDETALKSIADAYESVVDAGVYKASSVRVAEAAKIIENTQRDINIALMNELARIFNLMDIDTHDVLAAAQTKWNFLPFKPGLVGGHCIGVDPYYLTFCARKYGYHPEVILSGRKVNDTMGRVIAEQSFLKLVKIRSSLSEVTVRVLGITFKEDCNDIRNSKVIDIVGRLREFGCRVLVEDPLAIPEEVYKHYNIQISRPLNVKQEVLEPVGSTDEYDTEKQFIEEEKVDIVIMAVSHAYYSSYGINELSMLVKPDGLVVDVKGVLNKEDFSKSSISLWRV